MFRQISLVMASIAMYFFIAIPAFSESAPVYDADSMQQQFENSGDQGQDLPPPPPPSGGQEGTFVPMESSSPTSNVAPAMQAAPLPSNRPSSSGLEPRISRIEQRLNALQVSPSSARIETLQSEIQSLRAQVEQLMRQLQQIEAQQKTISSTIQADASTAKIARKNIKPIATKTSGEESNSTGTNTTKKPAEDLNVAEEQQFYQTAYGLIKAKKYNEAVNSLQTMLKKYPSGQFASNAHYWLGELYGLMSKNDQALFEFEKVVQSYPESPRIADAQLKVGLIYASQLKWTDAKSAFKKVINQHPGTASARLASEQLKQIKQMGH